MRRQRLGFAQSVLAIAKCSSYLWPLPCTLLGVCLGFVAARGRPIWIFRRGTIGLIGPGIGQALRRVPIEGGAAAITFGHSILARDANCFDQCFEHEWVHVRQYIWWGPLFVPAYLANSLWHWLAGGDPYLDNAFERQARSLADDLPTGNRL